MGMLTRHAGIRQHERQLGNAEIAAALAGRCIDCGDRDVVFWYDKASRAVLVVDRVAGDVVTMWRAKRKWVKENLSR